VAPSGIGPIIHHHQRAPHVLDAAARLGLAKEQVWQIMISFMLCVLVFIPTRGITRIHPGIMIFFCLRVLDAAARLRLAQEQVWQLVCVFLVFLCSLFISHIIQLTPQELSAEPKNSASAEMLTVARRPKEASREKTRPPPVSGGSAPCTILLFVLVVIPIRGIARIHLSFMISFFLRVLAAARRIYRGGFT